MMNQIEDLSGLLKHRLGDKKIVKHTVSRLTAAGDNYGSIMLAVKVELKSANGNETEELHLVAKVPPPTELMQKVFNTPITFKNEIFFYKNLVPLLKDFAKAEGVTEDLLNCFPEYYGSRSSLNPESDQVDGNAILLLNNLKIFNFEVEERTVGFDLESAKLILTKLAELHAVPLAMKLKSPEEFQKKIMKVMTEYKIFNVRDDMQDEITEKLIISVFKDAGVSEEFEPRVREAHLKNKRAFYMSPKNAPEYVHEPFSTVIHTDSWVNNFMLKFENGKPVDSKIVDFQLYEYGNPARDIVFFLFTSVRDNVLVNNFDELVRVYHDRLIEVLELFKCDIAPFSMEKFEIELKRALDLFEVLHCSMMLRPIFAMKNDVKELEDISEEDMKKSYPPSEHCKIRIRLMTEELIKRKWI